jgi:K+/H+ antiporter YhaU regulatory subunit KhtT
VGFFAERAANRMGMRQRYRTAARTQRRRSWMESKMGMRQDFAPEEEEPAEERSGYVDELERLAQLRDQGIVSEEEFQAKKKQLLGLINRAVATFRRKPFFSKPHSTRAWRCLGLQRSLV